jgi:hypothetical protein
MPAEDSNITPAVVEEVFESCRDGSQSDFDEDQLNHEECADDCTSTQQLKRSPFTEINPPGADKFTTWLAREYTVNDNELGEEAELDQPIRRFMGPNDTALVEQLRRRRRENLELNHGNASRGAAYTDVSYKMLDTPVWHNYSLSFFKQGLRQRPITFIRQLFSCQIPRRQNKGNPMRNFQLDSQLVTRIVLFSIGVLMSVVGFIISEGSDKLLELKIDFARRNGDDLQGFGIFISLNLLFGVVAFLPVAYRPMSAGSGIAEAKAVLNGVVLPGCTELRTLLCKSISVIFAGAASLPIGLDGPMIFAGLSIGENSQRFLPESWASLKSDHFRRDFASVGTACGGDLT